MNRITERTAIKKRLGRSDVEVLEARAYLSGVAFGAPTNLSAASLGVSPVAVQLADFNGDSKADLVVANSTDNISVLNSNGDGSFAAPVNIPVVGTPTAIATGHFETTGHLDIVAGTSGSPGSISIIVGNGDGTFLPANDIAALDDNSAIAVGDFNNDGNADILTVSSSAAPSGNAMLLLGNGTAGAFSQAPFNLPFGSVSAVAVGDFNGDGNLDFAVANELNDSVSVMLGNGDGAFQFGGTYPTGLAPTSIVVGNFTGKTLANGKPELDIVTANSTGGTVSYLANNGDGTFAAAVNSAVAGSASGGGPVNLSMADFNNDGRPDLLALLGAGSSAEATILLGNGDGTFGNDYQIATGGRTATAIAAGDLNDDGLPDVVLSNLTQVSSLLNAFSVGTATATTSVTATSLSANTGDVDQFMATVAPIAPGAEPTGSVDFTANGLSIGVADVSNGTAVLSTNLNMAGNIAIAAIFSGDVNYASSTATAITVVVTSKSSTGDTLIPVIQRSTLASALVGGTAAHGTATVQVTNSTAATIKGPITINLYATTDGVVDANSILVGMLKRKSSPVKNGADFTVTVPIKLKADTLPVADYRLLAQTVDPSGNLTTSVTGPGVTVATPFVQLSESFTRLALPATALVNSKTPLVALIKLTNNGNIASLGVTPLELYVSANGTPASGSSLNTTRKKLVIGVDKSVVVAVPLKAFPNVAAGIYSVGLQVTDPSGGVSSATSTSTVHIEASTIDLADAIVTAPTTAKLGTKVEVTLDLTNDGNIAAKGPLMIAFAGSATSDGSNSTPLSTLSVLINLAVDRTQRLYLKVLVPLNAMVGKNYLVATVDPTNLFSDPDLANNVSVGATPITFG